MHQIKDLDLSKYSKEEERLILHRIFKDLHGFDIEHIRWAWNTWNLSLWNEEEVSEFVNDPNHLLTHLDKIWKERASTHKKTSIEPLSSQIVLGGKFPKLLTYQAKHNILTTSGLVEMSKRGTGESATTTGTTHCAVGTGTTAEALADKTLETEIDRKEFDTDGDRATSGSTERYGMAFTFSDLGSVNREITEAGILTKVAVGELIARITANAISVTTGRIMTVQIDITHANGTEV